VLEAMQMGRPCVITNFAAKGFEALLQDEKNTLIAQNDADFAQKLQKLLENHDFSAQIAQSAQSDIQTHLNSISYTAMLSDFL
jgi:ActR/RegA family two-component response regulator